MTTPSAQARGRPRSEERDRDILDAAIEALVTVGYGAMTIEGIAARAGAGKATVYRRWRNKAELTADAIRRHATAAVPMTDTGDVRADLRAYLRSLADSFAGIDGALMATVTAERIRHPELGEAFDRRFVAERREHLRRMIRQGVERGQLPAGTDVELVADVGPALMLHALTKGRRPTRRLADRIVAQFLPE